MAYKEGTGECRLYTEPPTNATAMTDEAGFKIYLPNP